MSAFLITYDLKKVKNYPKLYKCLTDWSAQRLLESVWIANLRGPTEAIMRILMAFVDGDDAIAVIELPKGVDWATLRARPSGVALLRALLAAKAA